MNKQRSFQTISVEAPQRQTLAQGRYPDMVQALAMRSSTHEMSLFPFHPTTIRRHEWTLATAERHRLPVVFIGCAPANEGTKVFKGVETDWGLINIAEDPHYLDQDRRAVMPLRVQHELRTIARTGMDFEAIYIAHEVEKHSLVPGQSLTLEMIAPPAPEDFTKRSSMLNVAADGIWSGIGKIITGTLRLGANALSAGASVSAGVASGFSSSAYSYDPIIFGLHIDRSVQIEGCPLALWYYLASWTWEA